MRRGPFVLVIAALLLVLTAVAIRLAGPAPKASGARARSVLDGLLREQVPHPVGSPANEVVRDRIVSGFRALGYETAIQRTFVCNARPTCATIENIIARSGGQAPSPVLRQPRAAVLHYVPAGLPRGDGLEMSIIAMRSFSSYQQWKRLMPGTSIS
jgi:hypothetical protein